jgi:hypothetical protein
MAKYTVNIPVICSVCGRGFINRTALGVHFGVMHKERTMAKELPEHVFVAWDEDVDESYLRIYDAPKDAAELDSEIEVGVYQLVRRAKVAAPIVVSEEGPPAARRIRLWRGGGQRCS